MASRSQSKFTFSEQFWLIRTSCDTTTYSVLISFGAKCTVRRTRSLWTEWIAHWLWLGVATGGSAAETGRKRVKLRTYSPSSSPAGWLWAGYNLCPGSLLCSAPVSWSHDIRPRGCNSPLCCQLSGTESFFVHIPILCLRL